MDPPQVYLNFRGAELRQSFISHLEMALRRSGIKVYVDHVEFKGRELEFVFKGIEDSKIALVIFSQRYTQSSWCLDELVKIQELVEEGKLIAIPIYYKLSPSQVKNLGGDFGNNLLDLATKRREFNKLDKWTEALGFFSQRFGLVYDDDGKCNEDEFISEVILSLNKLLSEFDYTPMLQDNVENNEVDPVNEENKEEKKEESGHESSNMVEYDKPSPKQKVYISFRGSDTRTSFVSHLVKALEIKGVDIHNDRDVVRGAELRTLFRRIKKSMIALVIFSTGYTESLWCLEELVKIQETAEKCNLVVIPIFYKVKPSDVRYLKGDFGTNFWNLMRTNRDHNVVKWKEALESIASRIGFCLNNHSSENEFVTCIANGVVATISQHEGEIPTPCPSTAKGKSTELPTRNGDYVGMEQRMEQLEKKLEFDCNDTRIIGVVGMPGIGKTTLAMKLHEKWNRKFVCCLPLYGIRKKSEKYETLWLRKTLLDILLEGKFPVRNDTTHESVKEKLLQTKFFAVLDDVSDKKQLEFLLGDRNWIKKGSKIVITTCDNSLLEGFAHGTYVVPELNDSEAFQLFRYNAFSDHRINPTGTFLTLSRVIVDCARGHPLALKLLGRELYGSREDYRVSKLELLTKNPHIKCQDLSRLLTDQLSEKQKDVFLDIVCFFKSEDEYFVKRLLDSEHHDSTDAVSEVKDLVNKFRIRIAGGRVEMNGPLCEFSEDLDSRWLRLSNYKEIINMVEKVENTDVDNLRGIFLDLSKLTKSMCLDRSTFINMRNLRYLKIYDSCCPRQCDADCNLNFPDGLEFYLKEVRYLHWLKFPLDELPREFRPENLVDLRLPYSKIKRVWEGEKDTPRLKWVDLSHSRELLDLSGFSKAKELQSLNLEGCTSLDELPVVIQNMKSLVCLNLRGCIRLWSLPKINLISLKTLILSDCSNLTEFQLISENVEFLHLDGTSIKELPPAIQNLQRLVMLNLKNCKMLECLPNCLGNLEALEKLVLSGCVRLKNLPDVKNSLKHLQILLLDGTRAKEMPSISSFTESEAPISADMFLQPLGSHCNIREWPCSVNKVSSLRRLCLSGNDFVKLQPDIGKLYNLKWLDLKECKKLISLPVLPPRLQYFDADGCDSLERVANPVAYPALSDQIHATFNFSNCNKLDQEAKDNILSYTRCRSQLVLDELTRYNGGLVSKAFIGTCLPGWEVPLWFGHRGAGSELKPKLPPHWFDNKFIGIGLCAVVVFDGNQTRKKNVLVKCKCEFKNKDGSSIRFSCTIGGWSEASNTPRKIESSHVLIGFTSGMDINQFSEEDEEEEEKCVWTETCIRFKVTDGMEEINGCEVVKCGFTLVYATA